tara:strand:+ start:13925 stop:14548 length:624 start_codon:yes stop_codon:yes gene_type:complete
MKKIPKIEIPTISITRTNYYVPSSNTLKITFPKIDLIGCIKTHRDSTVKNTQIIEDDPNGAFFKCGSNGEMPSYTPMEYNPNKLKFVEQKPPANNIPEPPPYKQPEIPKTKEKQIITIPPCPDPKQSLRVGSYANYQKLEKVKAFELVNGECNIIWEPVKFQEQYIPEVSTIISTAVIGFVAASSPLILNAIKPIIKKLITKKKKSS